MTQNASVQDRRRAPRLWKRTPGQLIVFRGLKRSLVIGCHVLNRSKTGALIKVDDAAQVPDDFYLVIDGQPGQEITCTVARRGERLLGVRFVPQTRCEIRTIRSGA